MTEAIDTIVVGGGQAGLAMSWHLRRRGREHIVLEQGRIAERWHSERWDSLMFQFPNWMIRLPGHAYDGGDPDGFMPRDGIARFIADYAQRIHAPIRCGVKVSRVGRRGTRFSVATSAGDLEADHVVVATGPYQVPAVPAFAARLDASIHQVTANRYTRPADLPRGSVLVVGSGASGCQIAEDLARAGSDVWIAVGRHRRVPRRYRGRDFGWWQEKIGLLDRTREELAPDFIPPLITGVDGGHDVDLRRMARDGVHLLGSMRGVESGRAFFESDLNAHLVQGDAGIREFTDAVDRYAQAHGIDAPRETIAAPQREVIGSVESLDIAQAGIGSVVWATGYRYDFRWIDLPVFDEQGRPRQRRGVTEEPGLYFLGLPRLHKVKSAFLWGVGEDAEYIAERIAGRA